MHDGVYLWATESPCASKAEGDAGLAWAGAETSDMKELMHSLGELVVLTAKPLAPHKTGRLASLRTGPAAAKPNPWCTPAAIDLYAGVQHYGWPAHHINPILSWSRPRSPNQDIVAIYSRV